MKRLVVAALVSLLWAPLVFAQSDETSSSTNTNRANQVRQGIQEVREETRETFTAEREELRVDRQVDRESLVEKQQTFNEAAQQARQEIRTQLQSATSAEAREAILESAEEQRSQLQTERETLRSERIATARTHVTERINLYVRRLGVSLERGNQIMDRLNQAVSDFTEQGIDVGDTTDYLQNAARHATQAQEYIDQVLVLLDSIDDLNDTEEIRETVNAIKDLLQNTKTSISEMFSELRSAYSALKESVQSSESNEE